MTESEVHSYLRDIGRYPILPKEAQLHHCYAIHKWVNWPEGRSKAPKRIARAGRRSMDTMIRTNLRLVVSVAKKFQHRGLDFMDLIQEGNLGLIRGLELFDPTRGYQLSTYVYWWIRQGVTRALLVYGRTVRLPTQVSETCNKARRFMAEYQSRTGTNPDIQLVADHCNMTPGKLQNLFEAVEKVNCGSLDSIHHDSGLTYIDVVYCERPTPEKVIEKREMMQELGDKMNLLDKDVRQVLERTILDNDRIKDVSDDMKISPHRLKKLQLEGIKKLGPLLAA